MTPAELTDELLRLRGLLDQANTAVRDRGRKTAEAERDYREARAQAWLSAEGTAREREDVVNALTADSRYARDLADADRQAALEAVRNYRSQLSALQTISGLERELAAFDRTGPQGVSDGA